MTSIEVHYCVPCGHLERAQRVQAAILQEFGRDVDAVTLRTGDSGVFTVSVDGERIFDVDEDEFDLDGIVDDVRPRV